MKILENSKGKKSLGKIAEMLFIVLCMVDLVWMIFFNSTHWITVAAKANVPESVLIALHSSFYALVVAAIGIRRWGKIKGAD